MINIPTELLRTFVAVVDLRSFTKAAQSLGITQPAVSAQVKRLQQLLGGDLMDKSAPGVALTQMGETVLAYARRLLAINDQILSFTGPPAAAPHAIRVGMPGDFVGAAFAVGSGQFSRISGVAEVQELHSFDDAAAVDIKTRDDAFGKH